MTCLNGHQNSNTHDYYNYSKRYIVIRACQRSPACGKTNKETVKINPVNALDGSKGQRKTGKSGHARHIMTGLS